MTDTFKKMFIQKNIENDYINITEKEDIDVTEEYRKILDRVAIRLVNTELTDDNLIKAVMSLAQVERIIIVFSAVLKRETEEIAYLLNTNPNSIYVQKHTAIEKLRAYLNKTNRHYT